MKKVVLLFFALLLPVLIFLFLRSFGKNEFEVPVLFADSVSAPAMCTAYTYAKPYTVADSTLKTIGWKANDSLTLIVFADTIAERNHERGIQLGRVKAEFKNESYKILYVSLKRENTMITENLYSVSATAFAELRSCVFLMKLSDDVVIVDARKRIRGQYNLQEREDADRMIMQEMNILFKRY